MRLALIVDFKGCSDRLSRPIEPGVGTKSFYMRAKLQQLMFGRYTKSSRVIKDATAGIKYIMH